MTASANILTPTGRMVWGSLYEPRDKDFDGNPLVIKNGPDAGKPTKRWEFGLALKKTPGVAHFASEAWAAGIWAVGHAGHPAAAQRPDFAWKVQDGDSTIPNKRGNKNCDNEDYRGCWILSFSSSYAPKIVNADGSAYILEPNAVKPGYYIQVAGNVAPNTGASPGVYLNHNVVSLQGYGKEIVTGPDPKTLGFGGALPVGASATPLPAMAAPPAAPPAAHPATMSPPPPPPPSAAAAAPPPPPAVPVQPHPAFVAPAAVPPPPPSAAPAPPPPPPPAPVGPVMTAKAQGTPYSAMIAAGWTDETLRSNGYMV